MIQKFILVGGACLAIVAPMTAGSSAAAPANTAAGDPGRESPNGSSPSRYRKDHLPEMCSVVYERTRARSGSSYRMAFEQIMHEAAGATELPRDSAANKEKLRRLWKEHPEEFKCNSPDFDVPGGSLAKYGVAVRSFGFVNFMLKMGLDLNLIDPADNLTLLDYLQGQLTSNKGSEIEGQLQEYVDTVKAAGGKRASEIAP